MYTVKFLNSEEFEKLPYKGVHDALGLADRNQGVAYVRDTANPMDVFTAFHELEHLKGDDLDEHEDPSEDGVFYKKTSGWMKSAAPFAAFIPGVGPFLSAGLGLGGSIMGSREQAKAQQSQQQTTMDQFNPQYSMQPAMSQAPPNVIQTGGGPGSGMSGGGGAGGSTISKLRELISSRKFGFYSGRDAGNV